MHDPLFYLFAGLWLCAVLYQRIQSYQAVRAGNPPHSRYPGYPVLAAKVFRCQQENRAKALEIPIVMGAGILVICTISEAVGVFLIVTTFGFGFSRMVDYQFNLMRARRAQDARREMEAIACYYRGEDTDY